MATKCVLLIGCGVLNVIVRRIAKCHHLLRVMLFLQKKIYNRLLFFFFFFLLYARIENRKSKKKVKNKEV